MNVGLQEQNREHPQRILSDEHSDDTVHTLTYTWPQRQIKLTNILEICSLAHQREEASCLIPLVRIA